MGFSRINRLVNITQIFELRFGATCDSRGGILDVGEKSVALAAAGRSPILGNHGNYNAKLTLIWKICENVVFLLYVLAKMKILHLRGLLQIRKFAKGHSEGTSTFALGLS